MIQIQFKVINPPSPFFTDFIQNTYNVPKPLDYIMYVNKKFKVLNNPYTWDLSTKSPWSRKSDVLIEVEMIKENEQRESHKENIS